MFSNSILILIVTVCPSLELDKDGPVNLNSDEWKRTTYIEQALPLLHPVFETTFFEGLSKSMLIPHYHVINNKGENEYSVYVGIEESNESPIFFLYGDKHPESKNYKISMISTKEIKTEKCQSSKKSSCEELRCIKGNFYLQKVNNSKLVNPVYFSWKKMGSILQFVVQYGKNVVKCIDADFLDVKKLVMFGNKPQKILVEEGSFKQATVNRSFIVGPNFNLTKGSSIYMQYVQCPECDIKFILECGESEKKSVDYEMVVYESVVIFRNSLNNISGWNETVIDVKGTENLKNCSLIIKTSAGSEETEDSFWIIGKSVANIKINHNISPGVSKNQQQSETKTSTRTFPQEEKHFKCETNSEINNSNQDNWNTYITGTFYMCIVQLVLSFCYILFKYGKWFCSRFKNYNPLGSNNSTELQNI